MASKPKAAMRRDLDPEVADIQRGGLDGDLAAPESDEDPISGIVKSVRSQPEPGAPEPEFIYQAIKIRSAPRLPESEAAESSAPEPEFKYSGRFSRDSSTGHTTSEVVAMAQGYEDWNPIVWYEFLQGMVDHGRRNHPPPRVTIEYKDGRRAIFNGKNIDFSSDPGNENAVAAIEFSNSGPGLTPESLCIYHHEASHKTLGRHGRGTTIALTFLASIGLPVKVSSNVKGQAWTASTSLKETETGQTKVLHADGQWQQEHSNQTTFRVENPGFKMLTMLGDIGQHFLYANSKFPDAVVVPADPDAVDNPPAKIKIDCGHVMCLDGVVNNTEPGLRYVFVDGLRINTYNHHILPWSIMDLAEAEDYRYKIGRSADSSGITGYGLETVIHYAVSRLENRELLEKIIDVAIKNPGTSYSELSAGNYGQNPTQNPTLNKVTAELVKGIWEQKYNNVLIAENETEEKMAHKEEQDAAIQVVPAALYRFLKMAGVKTAKEITSIQNTAQICDTNRLDLPSAHDSDSLEKLMKHIAGAGGEAAEKAIMIGGKKYLQISFPTALLTREDFNGQTESTVGLTLRKAAIIATVAGVEYRIVSTTPNNLNEIEIKAEADPYSIGRFSTPITINSYERNHFPEYLEYPNGQTYLLMAIDDQNAEEGGQSSGDKPTRFEKLLAILRAASAKVQAQIHELKTKIGSRRKKSSAKNGQAKVASETSRPKRYSPIGAEPDSAYYTSSCTALDDSEFANVLIGQNGDFKRKIDQEEEKPPGYYLKNIGTKFSYLPAAQTAHWMDEGCWEQASIPVKRVKKYSAKHVVRDFDGTKYLEVLSHHKIIGVEVVPEDADIVFYRDQRSGCYKVKGKAEKLVYYTRHDTKADYLKEKPIDEEAEDVVDLKLLDNEWRNLILAIRSNQELTAEDKVQLVTAEWQRRFHYNDDQALDNQITGDSPAMIAANILNTSRGICNISATGFALVLRTIGIPSRVCSGTYNGVGHLWVAYWSGTQWTTIESLTGIEVEKSEKTGNDSIEILLRALAEGDSKTFTDEIGSYGNYTNPNRPPKGKSRLLAGIAATAITLSAALGGHFVGCKHPSDVSSASPTADSAHESPSAIEQVKKGVRKIVCE